MHFDHLSIKKKEVGIWGRLIGGGAFHILIRPLWCLCLDPYEGDDIGFGKPSLSREPMNVSQYSLASLFSSNIVYIIAWKFQSNNDEILLAVFLFN